MTTTREKCVGTVKRTGQRCQLWPIKGGTVCRSHGGAAPRVKVAAARNVVENKMREELRKRGITVTPVTNPLRAFQDLAGRAQAWMDLVESKLDMNNIRYESNLGTEQLRAEFDLFTRAQKEVRETLEAFGKLKIDERLMAINEGSATMVKTALRNALAAIGITGVAQDKAVTEFSKQLRIVRDNPQGETGPGF